MKKTIGQLLRESSRTHSSDTRYPLAPGDKLYLGSRGLVVNPEEEECEVLKERSSGEIHSDRWPGRIPLGEDQGGQFLTERGRKTLAASPGLEPLYPVAPLRGVIQLLSGDRRGSREASGSPENPQSGVIG